jgi:hypothetical protein
MHPQYARFLTPSSHGHAVHQIKPMRPALPIEGLLERWQLQVCSQVKMKKVDGPFRAKVALAYYWLPW